MSSKPIDHSYEEVRRAAVDILAEREKCQYEPSQYGNLMADVAELFARRENHDRAGTSDPRLAHGDRETFREVFWDLFRQGVITLGRDDSNREFPFFAVTERGRKMLEGQEPYFFHDVTSYEQVVRDNIPKIDETTLLYLKEAMQAFLSGCLLSTTVMLGVASESIFLSLMETIASNQSLARTYGPALKEWSMLRKLNKFRDILGRNPQSVPSGLREDLDTTLMGVASIIRNFRNDSGHPSGKLVPREQCYVLLRLFVPYCKRMVELRKHFSTTT